MDGQVVFKQGLDKLILWRTGDEQGRQVGID